MQETSQIRWLMYCKSAICKSGQFRLLPTLIIKDSLHSDWPLHLWAVSQIISSSRLGKSWCVQPQVNGIPSNIRLAIVSARSDVCGASNSTWSDMFIESTSTPMAISSVMALLPVMISLLLQR